MRDLRVKVGMEYIRTQMLGLAVARILQVESWEVTVHVLHKNYDFKFLDSFAQTRGSGGTNLGLQRNDIILNLVLSWASLAACCIWSVL